MSHTRAPRLPATWPALPPGGLTVHALAERLGVTPQTVNAWRRSHLLTTTGDDANGLRVLGLYRRPQEQPVEPETDKPADVAR